VRGARTPLPPGVWTQVGRIWEAVAETMATLSPREASFVLTNALVEDDPEDCAHMLKMRGVAERRGGVYVPVRLVISDVAEHARRLASPDCARCLKETDPNRARHYAESKRVLRTHLPEELTLDTAALSPAAAARTILEHARNCSRAFSEI
jgi:hypothetical protein